jgi:hypothetical protein
MASTIAVTEGGNGLSSWTAMSSSTPAVLDRNEANLIGQLDRVRDCLHVGDHQRGVLVDAESGVRRRAPRSGGRSWL